MHDLYSLGAKVYIIEGLHAKICRNEMGALIGSMNFLASSATKSREAAIYTIDKNLVQSTKDYIDKLSANKNMYTVTLGDKILDTVLGVADMIRSIQAYCIYCKKRRCLIHGIRHVKNMHI
jgi:uncharacterized membrane protein